MQFLFRFDFSCFQLSITSQHKTGRHDVQFKDTAIKKCLDSDGTYKNETNSKAAKASNSTAKDTHTFWTAATRGKSK